VEQAVNPVVPPATSRTPRRNRRRLMACWPEVSRAILVTAWLAIGTEGILILFRDFSTGLMDIDPRRLR
jgi:hypothetical protein